MPATNAAASQIGFTISVCRTSQVFRTSQPTTADNASPSVAPCERAVW